MSTKLTAKQLVERAPIDAIDWQESLASSLRYGSGYRGKGTPYLTDRRLGLQREQTQRVRQRAISIRKSYDSLLGHISEADIRSAKGREATVVIAEELVSFMRDLSGAGDL